MTHTAEILRANGEIAFYRNRAARSATERERHEYHRQMINALTRLTELERIEWRLSAEAAPRKVPNQFPRGSTLVQEGEG